MHTEECPPILDDARVIEGWPEDVGIETDVSTLPTLPAGTPAPLRLYGRGRWIALVGLFQGLRVSFGSGGAAGMTGLLTMPYVNGAVIPYPRSRSGKELDLNLWADAGASGKFVPARFRSREEAEAWVGRFQPTRGLVPTPALITPADGVTAPASDPVEAFGMVFSDRTVNWMRARQGDSFTNQSSRTSAASTATTGIKATVTLAQDGWLHEASLNLNTGNPGLTVAVQLELVRSAVTFVLGGYQSANPLPAVQPYSFFQPYGSNNYAGAGTTRGGLGAGPVPLLAGDVVQMNCTGVVAATTYDFHIGVRRERAAF